MPLHIPAFRDVLVQLSGDPIYNKAIAVTPGAGGIAFDGTYLYLNYYQGKEIYVVTPDGTLVNTLTTPKSYTDIDYEPLTDEIWAVSPAVVGIDRLSKADGSLIGNLNPIAGEEFTSIAINRYSNRLYLITHDLYDMFVLTMDTLNIQRTLFFPLIELNQPSVLMVAIGGENRDSFWVGFKSFPVMLGRIIKGADKVDAYRILGASFHQGKASISIRYVNNKWYYWGDWGAIGPLSGANLYELSGMPTPRTVFVPPVFPEFDQDIYRWFDDDDAENPTPKAAESTEITNVALNDILRFRIGLLELSGTSFSWTQGISIQYAKAPAGPWTDVAAIGSQAGGFRFYDGQGVSGDPIANLLLSNTTIKQYFVESAPSVWGLAYRGPNRGEYDICLQAFAPLPLQDYYFRAVCEDGLIKNYSAYPKLTSASYPSLRFSLREHKSYGAYYPVVTFSKSDASSVRVHTANGVPFPASLGTGYIFIVANRAWLNNKYLRFRWKGSVPDVLRADVYIYDGEYVRSSDTDFPSGSGIPAKGAGLLQTVVSRPNNWSWETIDVQASVGGGSETKCTIFFKLQDGEASYAGYIDLDWFEVNDSPGGVDPLYSEQFTDEVVMERTGTYGDYGYIGTGELPP